MLICMQKLNFITHFIPAILQQKYQCEESIELQYQLEEPYDFIGRQKINFKFFLRYSKDNLLKR